MESKEVLRIKKLRKAVFDGKHDDYCFLLNSVASLQYFTGFKVHEGCAFALIFVNGKGIVVTDGRYRTKVEQEVSPELFDILIKKPGKSYLKLIKKKFSPGCRFIMHFEEGYEREGLLWKDTEEIEKLWSNVILKEGTSKILSIRSVKEPGEIVLIKKAIEITEQALSKVMNLIKVGMTESEIASKITSLQTEAGASGDSFPVVVATGKNSALVHGGERDGTIKKGDLLQVDMGCVYGGYCSDLSRVVVIGARPTGKQHRVYSVARKIQEKIISRIKPGADLIKLNKQHFDWLDKEGFEWTHSFGHGIGLQDHELPSPNSIEEFVVKVGQVFTVEPGIYLPGEFGIRIEDMVLVTEDGCEVLTSFPKNLMVLDFNF